MDDARDLIRSGGSAHNIDREAHVEENDYNLI